MRLWGRLGLGLSAAAIVVAASASTEFALAADAPPVRASAEAVTVLAPGAAPQGSGLAMAFGPAAVHGSYRYSAAIRADWAKATAAKQQGTGPTAQASALVRHVRLFGGAVRVRKISASASLAVATGDVRDLTGGSIHGLVVLGHHVDPDAGATLPLGDWGTLEVLATQRTATGGTVAETITGMRLTLLHDHDGLAAGTVVDLGTATAAVTPPPAPATTGNGPGSGGTAPPPPPPPAPKKHRAPAHHRRPAHRPTTGARPTTRPATATSASPRPPMR